MLIHFACNFLYSQRNCQWNVFVSQENDDINSASFWLWKMQIIYFMEYTSIMTYILRRYSIQLDRHTGSDKNIQKCEMSESRSRRIILILILIFLFSSHDSSTSWEWIISHMLLWKRGHAVSPQETLNNRWAMEIINFLVNLHRNLSKIRDSIWSWPYYLWELRNNWKSTWKILFKATGIKCTNFTETYWMKFIIGANWYRNSSIWKWRR